MTSKPCSFCGAPSNPRYREVRGWEELRAAGGLNKIIARTPTGRVACDRCIYDIKHGMEPQSPKLFDPFVDEEAARKLWEREHPHRTIEWHQVQERTRRRYRERVSTVPEE